MTEISDVKPEFYADARMISARVTREHVAAVAEYPPYGLEIDAGRLTDAYALERALTMNARKLFGEVDLPDDMSCPYTEGLRNLGSMTLRRELPSPETQRLVEVVFPGAQLSNALIVGMIHRMPRIAGILGYDGDVADLARNSAGSLLDEPLHHPQQWAKAFQFCVANGYRGGDRAIDRETFLPDALISDHLMLETTQYGIQRVAWSESTEELRTTVEVAVADRNKGPERASRGAEHVTVYPAGTRLGDIAITEEVIGCPGRALAYRTWLQACDVFEGQGLWEQTSYTTPSSLYD